MKINISFLKYLNSQQSQLIAAKRLDVTPSSISLYKFLRILPSRRTALRIEKLSKGAVPAKSWEQFRK